MTTTMPDPAGQPADPAEGGPPGNDSCSDPMTIPSDATSFNPPLLDTTGAFTDLCASNNCGGSHNDVWYRFSPACDGTISLNTNGSNYNTILAIYPDDCFFYDFDTGCSGPEDLMCDNDSGVGNASQIDNFAVTAGASYRIAVLSTSSGGGMLDFNFVYYPQTPANNECSSAAVAFPWSYHPAPYCTHTATITVCEQQDFCNNASFAVGHSVYHQQTAPADGTLHVDTIGSSYDTVLAAGRLPRFHAAAHLPPAAAGTGVRRRY